MRRFFIFLLMLPLIFACSSHEEDLEPSDINSGNQQDSLSIRPYSYDITQTGMTLVYKVTSASQVEILYREQSATTWQEISGTLEGGVLIVDLTGLSRRTYYNVLVIARNEKGESVTDMQTILFDYESLRGTYFMQPYLMWGTPLQDLKKYLTNAGYMYEEEKLSGNDYVLECRYRYKEIKSEYILDSEEKLKEVLITFDSERAPIEELRRFISNALGYLSYGNIHVVIDGKEHTFPLYKTAEGTSYAYIYQLDEYSIVDYVCSANVDLNNKIYK